MGRGGKWQGGHSCLTARFCMYAQVDAELTIGSGNSALLLAGKAGQSRGTLCAEMYCVLYLCWVMQGGRAHAHVIHGYTVAGQSEIIESLLMYSADVHRMSRAGETALHGAAGTAAEKVRSCMPAGMEAQHGWMLSMARF